MQEPSELAQRLRVAACCIVVCQCLVYIASIAVALSRRLRTKPMNPVVYHAFAIIFDIIRLVHVLLVVIAIIILFVVAWFTTWDPENLTSAVGVYGTLLSVS
jgi:hypothetical protein